MTDLIDLSDVPISAWMSAMTAVPDLAVTIGRMEHDARRVDPQTARTVADALHQTSHVTYRLETAIRAALAAAGEPTTTDGQRPTAGETETR
jgi:hypothetical protein